jgi:dolichol-phosphate mannosyltransferase
MEHVSVRRTYAVPQEFTPAFRFGCVGLSGVVVNMTLLWMLTEHFHVHYLLSSVIATEATILSNFLLNYIWTFGEMRAQQPLYRSLIKFNVISIGGLLLTVGLLFVLTDIVGMPYLLSNVLAIGASTGLRYAASRQWVWKRLPNAPTSGGEQTNG